MASLVNRSHAAVKDQAGRKLGPRAIETRQRLLDATLQLLDERSVLDVSVAEIARQVGSVPSLFYHYFKDVEEAAQHVARDAANEIPAMVTFIESDRVAASNANATDLDGDRGLQRARTLVEAYIAHWERFRGALLFRNQAADRGDPAFTRIRRDALGPLIDALQRLIVRSQTAGRVAQDVHPYVAASGLVAILESLAAHADRVRHFNASKQQLIDTCARMIHSTVTGTAADAARSW